LLGGVALVGGSAVLTGCRPEGNPTAEDRPFTAEDIAFLDEVADTILPPTSTPGAKAAQTGAFMAQMVDDCYDGRDRKIFRQGMRTIDEATQKAHNVSFMKATPQQRLSVLEAIERDEKSYRRRLERRAAQEVVGLSEWISGRNWPLVWTSAPQQRSPTSRPRPYFRMMKELALLGYFTSEIGCTQAQRYVESPGRYDPCVPYQSGEKDWAQHA
jgi:Gluconate 2-dehydrogenase subunit 3